MQFIDLKTQQNRVREGIEKRFQEIFEHGQYVMGPEVAELESELAKYTGSTHAIACASGTDALLMALMALDVGPGDEVITTPFTFISSGEMIVLLGATPVFVDVDPHTYNLDPEALEAILADRISPRTKAIVPISLYGQCADFDAINEIAARYELPVIEDAAQSFGASYKGRRSCNLSTIGATSFFPSKPLGCYGDGGALFTNDDEIAKKLHEIRVHGQDRRYHHPRVGINGRLDTLQAAVVLEKLKIFDDEVKARGEKGAYYTQLLKEKAPGVKPPYLKPGNTSVYAQYTIRVENREEFQNRMKETGVPTSIHYPAPLHYQPAFSFLNKVEGTHPHAERAAAEVISLPMHPYLTDDEQQKVVEAVSESV